MVLHYFKVGYGSGFATLPRNTTHSVLYCAMHPFTISRLNNMVVRSGFNSNMHCIIGVF